MFCITIAMHFIVFVCYHVKIFVCFLLCGFDVHKTIAACKCVVCEFVYICVM